MTTQNFSAAVESTIRDSLAPHLPTVTRIDGTSGRFYMIEGDDQPYVSVTHALQTIAKPALINWAANQERSLCLDTAADLYLDLSKTPTMSRASYIATLTGRLGKQKAHKRELDKAADIGTQVHRLVEWNLRRDLGQKVGPEPHVIDAAQWAFMSWQDWANSVHLKPLFIEQTVFSRTYRYAGTMDILAEVNGVVTLIDLKTGKSIYGEAMLQNVAYQQALIEMGHLAPAGGLIVRLPKVQTDPAFETAAVPPVAELFPTFLNCLSLWHWWYAQEEAYRQRRQKAEVAS